MAFSGKLIAGKYYFGGVCPKTGTFIVKAEDPSEGAVPYPEDRAKIFCADCQQEHFFDFSEVQSRKILKD